MQTNESTLVAELTAIRTDLAELRRYVRTQPGYVKTVVHNVSMRMWRVVTDETYETLKRIATNLEAGADSILACPAALEGYLAGADWEIAGLVGRCDSSMLQSYLAGIPDYPEDELWSELQLVIAESREHAARLAYPSFSDGRIAKVLSGDDSYEVWRYEAGDAVATGKCRVVRDMDTMRKTGLHFDGERKCQGCDEWRDDVCAECDQCPNCKDDKLNPCDECRGFWEGIDATR